MFRPKGYRLDAVAAIPGGHRARWVAPFWWLSNGNQTNRTLAGHSERRSSVR
jgi:hypothetical protein